MQKTAEDEALRHRLEELLGVGDGNISGEAELDEAEAEALTGERAPVVADFAAQNGFDFSVEDLVQVVDAFSKHHSGELSDAEFAALIGFSAAPPQVANPLKRFTRYMKRTYLGV